MLRGLLENVFCRKGKNWLTDPQKSQGPLKDPVRSNKGSRLIMDPLGVSSCVSKVYKWLSIVK